MGYRNIKKQKNLFFFFKLRILIFQCPGTTHITNFTRMPHMLPHIPSGQESEKVKEGKGKYYKGLVLVTEAPPALGTD